MYGKVSVVRIVSSMWANAQVETFISKEKNPELHQVLAESKDVAQQVWINHENPIFGVILNERHEICGHLTEIPHISIRNRALDA